MVDRTSPAYQAGRIVGRLLLIGLGYFLGKRWGRRPIDKGFPEKNNNNLKNNYVWFKKFYRFYLRC
jgi:hypothetical protein